LEAERICHLNAVGKFVRDHENRHLAPELIDRLAECIRRFVIQIAGRLIEDQDE